MPPRSRQDAFTPAARALTPAARALRLQRIYAHLQEGRSYADIAEQERISRERLRQILRAADRREEAPDHRRMQIARLMPAIRLAAYDVENGDAKSVATLLQLLDRLDRYYDARRKFRAPRVAGYPRGSRARALDTPGLLESAGQDDAGGDLGGDPGGDPGGDRGGDRSGSCA